MKTFKLVGLKIDEPPTGEKEIPLLDGLVINKEDGENSWLIEALIPKEFLAYFEEHKETNAKLRVFVTISKPSNAPAQIAAIVNTITILDGSISILLIGRLLTSRPLHNPEDLLQSLMEQGLTGNSLMEAFKANIQQRKEMTKL